VEKQAFNFNQILEKLALSNDHRSEEKNFTHILRNKSFIDIEQLLLLVEDSVKIICNSDTSVKFNKKMNEFYWGIQILSLMEEPRLFNHIIKLCSANPDVINIFLGEDFTTEDLSIILTLASNGNWILLIPIIENPENDLYIRTSCLKAYINITLSLKIKKEEHIKFFKNLIYQCSEKDILWNSYLVCIINDYLPKECIKEIKFLFGLCLIDTSIVAINSILANFKTKNKDMYLQKVQEDIDFFKTKHLLTEKKVEENSSKNPSIDELLERKAKKDLEYRNLEKKITEFKSYPSKKK